jgi:hypothetical protein
LSRTPELGIRSVVLAVWVLAPTGCRAGYPPPARAPTGAFVAVYRWHIRGGCEEAFQRAWRAETLAFRSAWGSYGTQLSRGDDGTWVAMAYWPSLSRWKEAHARPLALPEAEATLSECILDKERELHLEVAEDLTRFPDN